MRNQNWFTKNPLLIIGIVVVVVIVLFFVFRGTNTNDSNSFQNQETNNPSNIEEGFGESNLVSKEEGFSRNNPASLNHTLITKNFGYEYRQEYDLELTLIEVIRGESAWTLIEKANMFNDKAPEGKEYILAKFRWKLTKTSDDKPYKINRYFLEAVSEKGIVYDTAGVVPPEPILNQELYPGATGEGWVDFEVDTNDKVPLVRFNDDETLVLWFKLY